jgi:hypothetical protein
MRLKLYWDQTFSPEKGIQHSRPDITYFLRQKRIAYVIDAALPSAENVAMVYSHKMQKYIKLAHEIKE